MDSNATRSLSANGEGLPLASDILEGAEAISHFLFGSTTKSRRVYRMAEAKELPVFRVGSLICARKSTLVRWIEQQEQTA